MSASCCAVCVTTAGARPRRRSRRAPRPAPMRAAAAISPPAPSVSSSGWAETTSNRWSACSRLAGRMSGRLPGSQARSGVPGAWWSNVLVTSIPRCRRGPRRAPRGHARHGAAARTAAGRRRDARDLRRMRAVPVRARGPPAGSFARRRPQPRLARGRPGFARQLPSASPASTRIAASANDVALACNATSTVPRCKAASSPVRSADTARSVS